MGKGAARSASRRRPLTITFLLSRFPFPALGLPGPRLPSCLIIEEEDHRPNLALAEEILPHRHRRVPGRALARQAGPALGDPPEHEALGELRDGAVVLEVRRQRVERRGVVPLAVEIIAVAGEAILVVDALPQSAVGGEGVPLVAQRVLEPRQGHRLAPERDVGGRRRGGRAQIGGGRDRAARLAEGETAAAAGYSPEPRAPDPPAEAPHD